MAVNSALPVDSRHNISQMSMLFRHVSSIFAAAFFYRECDFTTELYGVSRSAILNTEFHRVSRSAILNTELHRVYGVSRSAIQPVN